MIGIDTNVLVRFLVADDERQFGKARGLIRHEATAGDPVLINQLVRMECEWVLRSRYGLAKEAILGALPCGAVRWPFMCQVSPRLPALLVYLSP